MSKNEHEVWNDIQGELTGSDVREVYEGNVKDILLDAVRTIQEADSFAAQSDPQMTYARLTEAAAMLVHAMELCDTE